MNEIWIQWGLFYFLPAAITMWIVFHIKAFNRKIAVIHIGLLISILLLFLSGAKLNLKIGLVSIANLALAGFLVFYLIPRRVAALYIFSSFIQELCLILAAVLLITHIGLIWAVIATALVYSFAHLVNKQHWQIKLSVTFIWGIFSIILYYYFQQPLINLAIHIIGGAFLISRGKLYENM